MSASKKTNIILWSSLVASVAGIAAVAVALRFQKREQDEQAMASHLRDVQDVLADCYEKINEIEQRLPSALSERLSRVNGSTRANAPQN